MHCCHNNKHVCICSDCSGFQTARVAHDLTWERVANTAGGKGVNIPLDLKNEHLNNEFKGNRVYLKLIYLLFHFQYIMGMNLYSFLY